jgi:arylsulfatase A-like enzyme
MTASSQRASSSRPNIVVILTDQQRFDTIQALGSRFAAKTPNMDSLVREGIAFENAFCTSPICSPSRATLMTGYYPSQVGVPGLLGRPSPPLSPAIPTIGKLMAAEGYETVYHGKWHLGGSLHEHGFSRHMECSHDESTRLEASRFWKNRDWLNNPHPFFHVVSFLDPHDHYFFDPQKEVSGFTRPWESGKEPLPTLPASRQVDWKEEKWGSYFRFYEELLERVDGEIGELLHQLRCSGFFHNSWIIFSADHGDMAGEHNLPFKGPFMYEGQVRVPLVIVPPRPRFGGPIFAGDFSHDLQPGKRSQMCSLLDIVPTILDLAGAEVPKAMPGRSLVPIIKDSSAPAPHETIFAETCPPPVRMARTKSWKYVLYQNGEEELYAVEKGLEQPNLAAKPEYAATKAEMRALLEKHLKDTRDSFLELPGHDQIINLLPRE